MQSVITIVSAVAALLTPQTPSAPGANDFLVLKDGRVVTGRKIERADGGLKLVYTNGQVLVPSELVQDFLIEGDSVAEPTSEEDKAQLAKGNVRFEGKWILKRQRDELIAKRLAERKKYFADIAARREWRNRAKVNSKHFTFEHTLPDNVFQNYRDLMEAYFDVFVRDWKIKLPHDLGPLLVCLHIDFDAMVQIGGAGPGVLGYFKFVRPMELNFYHDRLDPEFTEEVMFHETNHYLQKLIDVNFAMPHFPGESLAEYYGASHWDPVKKKLTPGLILEGRLCEVQADIDAGNWKKLEALITTEGDYEHYTWGWSLVHFLMSTPAHAKDFQKFVFALANGENVKREGRQAGSDYLKTVEAAEVWNVFKAQLGLEKPEQVDALEKEWHAYIKSNLKLVSARGYEQAARSAANMYPRRVIKAKRLYQTAIDMGSKNPLTYHGYGSLLMEEDGDTARAIEMFRKAIAIDPLNGTFYRSLGHALSKKGDKEEAKRLRKLGAEIDPDDPWIALDALADDD